ncbi:uncharacterized protein LOC143215359 [Lasioglossum baleicum]|uniref:uncharacterized protein LOC143215359 n=1 Tax=Lasioglossum baleicum TaxID=434251 RepID=UPI003FCDE782
MFREHAGIFKNFLDPIKTQIPRKKRARTWTIQYADDATMRTTSAKISLRTRLKNEVKNGVLYTSSSHEQHHDDYSWTFIKTSSNRLILPLRVVSRRRSPFREHAATMR